MLFETLGKVPGAGGHRDKGSTSLASIGAALVPTVFTAVAYLIAFSVLRSKYPNIYAPRTYFRTIPEQSRTPSTRPGGGKWYRDFLWIDDKFILRYVSLEGYLFLRFFRIIILICFVGVCLTWPILLPVNYTGGGSATQLDRLTFSNAEGKNRLYAHTVVAWLFVIFILMLITRERMFLISLKQAYFTTNSHAKRLSARTVLFLAAPPPAFDDNNLEKYFGPHAKRSWKIPQIGDLETLTDDRNDKVYALEEAEIKLERNVNSMDKQNRPVPSDDPEEARPLIDTEDTTVRPKARTIPLVGKQIDPIDHNLHKIPQIVEDIESKRKVITGRGFKTGGALFVEFDSQLSAYQAWQTVGHHTPLAMQPRFIGLQPREVLWQNLHMSPLRRIFFDYVVFAFLIATIIFWAIPIGFIGTVSNISYLADKVSFLSWLKNLPPSLIGLIQGFLPAFLISYVVSYVPKIFRYVIRLTGAPTTVDAEIKTLEWYFAFQVIQVFLVTTFSSGAAAVATKIFNNPASVMQLLADNLPKASNFYLTYFIVQGIASAANNLFNYSDLLSYVFFDRIFDTTPRQKYDRLAYMNGCSWGAWYPKFANFAVIAIAYSCIAPLVLGFALLGLIFFYLSYRYALLYTRAVKIETRGDAYATTLQHILVGVYLLELCLAGLFSTRKATGPSALIIILLIGTIIYHITVNKFLSPLEEVIAMDILTTEGEDLSHIESEGAQSEQRGGAKRTSFVQKIAGSSLPSILLDPLASVLEPRLFTPHEVLRKWLTEEGSGSESPPEYSKEDIDKAYTHPAMISKTPKIWLPKDPNGISKWANEKNEAAGLPSTDEGAELNEKNEIVWDLSDLSAAPIFKTTKEY